MKDFNNMEEKSPLPRISDEVVMKKIYLIRDMKVMLDHDLAELYGVENRSLKQAVRRNIKRFPEDFMIELTKEEHDGFKQQYGSGRRGAHSKYPPYAFSELGVAMLSSILNSDRAIMVNILIIRVFAKMREMLVPDKDVLAQLRKMQNQLIEHDNKILLIFEYIKQLEETRQQELEQKERKRIGFKQSEKGY